MTSTRVSRVFQVLSLVAFSPAPVKLKEIGQKLDLHPSMVSRIVAELIAAGLITKCAYRSVIGTPALAVLGSAAGRNHPLTAISKRVLHPFLSENPLSCEFAAASPMGLWHFYKVTRETPPPAPLWRSDLAAVIFAASNLSWEELLETLDKSAPPEIDRTFAPFKERFLEAQQTRYLINFHAGRYRQITVPVFCGDLVCALSVSGNIPDQEEIFLQCSRLGTKIRSLYDSCTDSDA